MLHLSEAPGNLIVNDIMIHKQNICFPGGGGFVSTQTLGYDQIASTMCPQEGLRTLVFTMKSPRGINTRSRKQLTTGKVQNERFHNTQHRNSLRK